MFGSTVPQHQLCMTKQQGTQSSGHVWTHRSINANRYRAGLFIFLQTNQVQGNVVLIGGITNAAVDYD